MANEELALAEDREQALAQRIPGTEEHFYHRCLWLQHQGRLSEVGPVVEARIARLGRT